jgi:hypothetical protein
MVHYLQANRTAQVYVREEANEPLKDEGKSDYELVISIHILYDMLHLFYNLWMSMFEHLKQDLYISNRTFH